MRSRSDPAGAAGALPVHGRRPAERRVLVVALGGTIAMSPRASSEGGAVPQLDGAALVSAVPALSEVAEIHAHTFANVPSAHLTLDTVLDLARHLDRAAPDYSGIVVTTGTDTLEEVAFALDLLWAHRLPLVVTGAMRHAGLPGADGPANLLAGVCVAAAPAAVDLGCVVVMDDHIHAARLVAKCHASAPSAFASPSGGPLGWVAERAARLLLQPPRRVSLDVSHADRVPPVALLRIAIGDDGALLRALTASGHRGVVVEAMGAGHVPLPVAEAVSSLVDAMPVAIATRTGAGAMLHGTYAFPGSESDLRHRGAWDAGPLSGVKARVLLSLLLASDPHAPVGELRPRFEAIVDRLDR